MKYIAYECGLPGTLSGGFGDRIVGIVSTLFLAKVLNAEFLLKWHDNTDIQDFFEIRTKNIPTNVSAMNYTNHDIHSLDELFSYKNVEDIFVADLIFFNTNQNIWQFLARNPHYSSVICDSSYAELTFQMYNELFSKYMIPTEKLLQKVNDLIGSERDLVGIQLRFGDVFMHSERKQINIPPDNFSPIGKDIDNVVFILSDICSKNRDKTIFLTSDIDLSSIIQLHFNHSNIKYLNNIPTHTERSLDKTGIEKTFVDFWILTKCKILYISLLSNFGRCPVFINYINKEVYAIYANKNVLEVHKPTVYELSCKSVAESLLSLKN